MPDALSLSRSDLPEEIATAIDAAISRACEVVQEAHEGTPESTLRLAKLSIQAQEALTAAILSRLGEAQTQIRTQAMEQLAADAGWELDWDRVRAERDAALARVERLEKRVNAALDDACRMSAILLMAGEMTAQERRTARAVANGLAAIVRDALSEVPPQGDH